MAMARADIRPFQLLIWERLRLTVGKEGQEGNYSCRLSDIKRDRLIISRPHFERGHTLLADNRVVTVYCTRADAVYAFSARIKETQPKSPDTMYLLDLGSIKRVQRRRFVRIDTMMRVNYAVLPRPIKDPINLAILPMVATRSINLSAGGMLIAVEDNVGVDDLLLISFEPCGLTKLPQYILAACRHSGTDNDKQRVAGMEFILQEDLPRYLSKSEERLIPKEAILFDDRMQNVLVSEIFSEQLVMRQKGLL